METELSKLRAHCAQIEGTAKKLDAMEIVEVRRLIDEENQKLQFVRAEIEKVQEQSRDDIQKAQQAAHAALDKIQQQHAAVEARTKSLEDKLACKF